MKFRRSIETPPARLPSHSQLLLPVMESVAELGGSARAGDVIDLVAERLGLPEELRELSAPADRGRPVNLFARRARWVRQTAVDRGLLDGERRGEWALTARGNDHLRNSRPGVVITIYETEGSNGTALWAEAESASAVIRDGCVNLIITSPPYPLVSPKQYGNLAGDEYLEWLKGLTADWRRLLVDDGSLVLNLGDVWNRGEATLSLYQERLLLYLCDTLQMRLAQRFVWRNPSKLPATSWVTVKRVRVKTQTENVYWLSKGPNPKADNRKVLREYSSLMRRLIARGGENRALRPCGHGDTRGAFGRDNGGSIPSNVIEARGAHPSEDYYRLCREHGLPVHPARFPEAIPEFFIKFLTDPGDLVYDPFFGSGRVGAVSERLGRQWIGSDRSLAYLSGSKFNFPSVVNLAPDLCPIGGDSI